MRAMNPNTLLSATQAFQRRTPEQLLPPLDSGTHRPVRQTAALALLIAVAWSGSADAAPVVTYFSGGTQRADVYNSTFIRDTEGTPTSAPLVSGWIVSSTTTVLPPRPAVSNGSSTSFSTGSIATRPFPDQPPIPGVGARVDVQGTANFLNAVVPYSISAQALASAVSGRLSASSQYLSEEGNIYPSSSIGIEMLDTGAWSHARLQNMFFLDVSIDDARQLATQPVGISATMTLTGHSDFLDRSSLSPNSIGPRVVASLETWADNYQDASTHVSRSKTFNEKGILQDSISVDLLSSRLFNFAPFDPNWDPSGGELNCLTSAGNPVYAFMKCTVLVGLDVDLSTIAFGGYSSSEAQVEAVMSWTASDRVSRVHTDAAFWGAPLALQLPSGQEVPEPGTASLVLAALSGLLWRSRRSKFPRRSV